MGTTEYREECLVRPVNVDQGDYDSQDEREYAAYLRVLQAAGHIVRFRVKPLRFRLAKKTWYTPDFEVITHDCIEFHEVKGFMREAGRLRYRTAADLNPEFRWFLVRKGKPRDGMHWELSEYPKE